MPGPRQRSVHGEADRLQRARRWSLARWPGRWQAGRQRRSRRTGHRGAYSVPAAAVCPGGGAGVPPPRAGLPAPWRSAVACGASYTHQGTPVSAAIGCVSVWRLVRRRRQTATPPLPGCQALVLNAGAGAPAYTPTGERGIPPPRKVEGLFPARLGEPSRAAEPVKATPCGWLEDSPALTEPAALPQCVVAWPEKCRCGHRPREVPARRAPVALPLVAACGVPRRLSVRLVARARLQRSRWSRRRFLPGAAAGGQAAQCRRVPPPA